MELTNLPDDVSILHSTINTTAGRMPNENPFRVSILTVASYFLD